MPRGRTYVRNGSVCHLEIKRGEILAKVAGSDLYNVRIRIKTLTAKKWKDIKARCAGQVGSLLELLQGKLSDHVMQVVTDRKDGLFPLPGEISLNCDCPDWAVMCKHVAAVMYGVGARLDNQPELLFKLRGVDHEELISADAEAAVSDATSRGKSKRLAGDDLADVFGIELESPEDTDAANKRRTKRPKKATARPRQAKTTEKAAAKVAAKVTAKAAGKSAKQETPIGKKQTKKKAAAKKRVATPV